MDIKELEDFRLADAVKFHNKLNPALWTERGKLDPEVKEQLLTIAKDFMSELGISSPKVEDITISGSNAAYTYTPHSDLDLHILVDFNKLPDDKVYQELFTAKKNLYNDNHDIKVHGVPVELYVQDSNQPVVSLGEYSLLKNEWIKIPKKRKANFDQNATKAKYQKLGNFVELAIKSQSLKRIEKALEIIKRYRKAGLDKTGEFGPENLAFKALRSQGYIKKLYDLKNQLHSKELSIEDYHPNAKPRGPEFPPTMPAGTVKVDVSDVYDWYKLGQHISDLEGLGKHDFGKGPPSTILSFGDEDTEHKYIDDLMKTGLTTTDIDPKGHEPKKGQKTDPRYNVGEGGAETSWSDGDEKITLQDILELTKHIKQINLPINDNLKSKLLHWDGNPEEIERINQVTVSNQFPILVMLDSQGQIDWILDGNHRLHKAIRSQAKTIPAKLIKPSDLSDKAKRVFHIKEQGVAESLLNENVTELYHGTLAKNVPSILANGLNPTVGEFTRSIYANKAKPLVFAADASGSRGVYCALVGQMHTKLNITTYPPSAEDVAKHCAILVISKDVGKFRQYNAKRRQGSKEPTDYTSEQTIHIDKVITGKELLQWIKTHNADRGEMCTIDNQQGVAEAFDQPYKLKWEKGEFGDIDAYTILPDGSPLSIMFNKEDNGLWMAEFYRSNTQDVTGEGDAQKIFATVLHAINQFIKKVKPKQITFSTVKENDPTGSRSSLYDRLVQRYASNLGYSVERHAASNKVSYDLIRQGKLKEASGYIPSAKEKNDPRFKTALTVDVKPDSIKKNAKAFGFKVDRAGNPPLLRK